LQCAKEHKLYTKIFKCSFFQSKIHYLGHIISREGIIVDPTKIEAIWSGNTPTIVHEVCSFMGLASIIGYLKKVFQK
jgi:hypothetical protein